MTHRPYTPPAWQSKPLSDGRVTLLVVPIRPARGYQSTWLSPEILQAAPSCYLIENNGRLGTQMQHPKANQDSPMSPLTWVPLLYAPGDLIWCRETWSGEYAFRDVIPSQRESVFTPDGLFLRDNIWYWADGSPEFGDFERPRSPATMPKWAARTWLRCTGVEVRRVQTISHAETIRNGRAAYANSLTIDCDTPTPRDDFAKAFPNFAANPWAAFTTVEKISKEDV